MAAEIEANRNLLTLDCDGIPHLWAGGGGGLHSYSIWPNGWHSWFCWWSVICYLTQNKSPQPVEGTKRGLDIWKVTCLQGADCPVDIGMCGLCGPERTFIQLACKGMMLRRITEHPTVVTLHWDRFFFPAFWFIHANMSKHQAQSPERKQEREGGGRWGGGGRGELEHLCDTEQQVRVKQMERRRKRSVCFSSQSFNFLPDEPSTAAKGRSR